MPMPPHLQKLHDAKHGGGKTIAAGVKIAAPAVVKVPAKPGPKPVKKAAAPVIVERRKVDRLSLVESIVASIGKELDVEITPMSRATNIPGIVRTRSATLNHAIGRGGLPFGRLIVFTGGEGGGKTTEALETCAEVQAMGGIAMYQDAEHKLDLDYARKLGVNADEMIISYPDNVTESFQIMTRTIDKARDATVEKRDKEGNITQTATDPIPIVIIMDSVNALLSKIQSEADYGENNSAGLGAQARAFSECLPKFIKHVRGQMVMPILISQQRSKMSTGPHGGSGKEKVAGGNAVKFYAALILDIVYIGKYRRGGAESGPFIGSELEITPIKNQVGAPHQKARVNNLWGSGTDAVHSLLLQAVKMGVLNSSSGGWYEMPWDGDAKGLAVKEGCIKFQGQLGYKRVVAKVPAVAAAIEAAVYAKFEELAPMPEVIIPEGVPPEDDEEPASEPEEAPAEVVEEE